nr:RNA-directed DNA polymerase, eukaryota [Tanacetum cinerariifolium]
MEELDKSITTDEIRVAVWDCVVLCFFDYGFFPRGCNSSFIALIPKVTDTKFVTDFWPISLIVSVYNVVTKILTNRLAMVIFDLVSDTQSAFVAGRHILDGPFIVNEVLAWRKCKKKQAIIFKIDFAKAYDSVRWDILLDVLQAFGFGPSWYKWICGIFSSNMASILVNGSPTTEFPLVCGLKQGDPLAPILFILIMESLYMSVSRAASDGVFKGLQIHSSLSLSHLFYVDDTVFIGEWSDDNLDNLIRILNCFHLASGLKINVNKSQVLGVGVPPDIVNQGASRIGGRLTLLKSVLGVVPIYNMSIYKTPKGVLHEMEMLRNKFFNGTDVSESKITWVVWDKVLASKEKGGLGVSSFFALNRAFYFSSGYGDSSLKMVPCDSVKEASVAAKFGDPSLDDSFRRQVRDGSERQQWLDLESMLDAVSLSSSSDRWYCDFNGDAAFCIKEVRSNLDDLFLPFSDMVTRWVRYVPIKINVFTWRARLDRLPIKGNLINRGVSLDSPLCPICGLMLEDSQHLFFRCDTAKCIFQRICRWWNLQWVDAQSFDDWLSWFKSVRMPGKPKDLLEGVFYTSWWHILNFQNRLIFDASPPRRSVIFDDIVSSSFNWCVNRSGIRRQGHVGCVGEVGEWLCTDQVQGRWLGTMYSKRVDFGGKMPFDLAFDVDFQSRVCSFD